MNKRFFAIVLSAIMIVPILCLESSIFVEESKAADIEYIPEDKIVMTWDYIIQKEDNDRLIEQNVYESLDVISPTWFSIKDPNGTVECIADKDYVNRAHEYGVKVWALVDNCFDDKLTFQVLSKKNIRHEIITQIVKYAKEYDIDGINIDFEAMSRKTGVHFEKFIVELYAELVPLNICLSVDIPAVADGNWKAYDISLIANNSDYIVLMAYDQHHEFSDRIGTVASINWVKQCLEAILEYVSYDKIILGVPFYTRVWVESKRDDKTTISSQSEGMQSAYNRFEKAASIWEREEQTEQIYAEYTDGSKTFKVWLEDEHSLSLKLDTVNDYTLAGVSSWRRGLEWPETWNLFNAYFR